MHLVFQRLDMTLEMNSLEKPIAKSIAEVKALYEDWKYFNKCYMIIMKSHMDESMYASLLRVDTT